MKTKNTHNKQRIKAILITIIVIVNVLKVSRKTIENKGTMRITYTDIK